MPPQGKPRPVVKPGEFAFAAVALDHGHINGQCNGLSEAGGELRWVYDPDPAKVEAMLKKYPQAKAAPSIDAVLDDPEIKLVAAAAIPCERGPLGVKVMRAGKDYFTDKTPFTSLDQLDDGKKRPRKPAANTWFIIANGCTWNAPWPRAISLPMAPSAP